MRTMKRCFARTNKRAGVTAAVGGGAGTANGDIGSDEQGGKRPGRNLKGKGII